MERATELEWLKWFYDHADFGPADGDVHFILEEAFREASGKELPEGYTWFEDDEAERMGVA